MCNWSPSCAGRHSPGTDADSPHFVQHNMSPEVNLCYFYLDFTNSEVVVKVSVSSISA